MSGKSRIGLTSFCALMGIFCMALLTAAASAESNGETGAEMIRLEGGVLGEVPFPHRLHQRNTNECNVCHDMFPKRRGAIAAKQKAGDLKKQQVMNGQCIKCHQARQSAEKPSGPAGCAGCHQR
ncbi:MAG: cytochrome c3 family protein [Desulfobacterales bacterium]|nr:cytochrome c3 family protein [Desulfobacterales bacterium]